MSAAPRRGTDREESAKDKAAQQVEQPRAPAAPPPGLTRTEARVWQWAQQPENQTLAATLFPPGDGGQAAEVEGAPWFRLAMYREVADWTGRDWVVAIGWRWGVWAALESPQNAAPTIARVAHFIKGLSRDLKTGGAQEASSDLAAYGAPSRPSVAELDDDDIREMARDLEWGSYPGLRAVLSVDLDASDEAIEASFRAWLKSKRPMPFRRAAMTADDMRNFVEAQVIPYLDLRLFELAAGRRIKVRDVAAALFPAQAATVSDPEKKLGKTTRTYARRLMSTNFYKRLLAQFAPPP